MNQAFTKPEAGLEPVPGYRLVERLGSGGFGEVWKANTPGGFQVALKFIPLTKTGGAMELRALELLRDIRHPNLLVTFAAWKINEFLIIAMELADQTLMDRFHEAEAQGRPGIPQRELLEYFQGAASGIDFLNDLHKVPGTEEGVAFQHRDIKPQNILLVGSGVKLADFGLARIMKHAVTGHSGDMTPHYAAPEFFKGQTTSSSDQYCLAMTYCKTRGGRLAFEGSLAEVMAGHLGKAPDLSMLPASERDVVARALAKEPGERWRSCRAFVEALRACPAAEEVPRSLGTTVTERAPIPLDAAQPDPPAPGPPPALLPAAPSVPKEQELDTPAWQKGSLAQAIVEPPLEDNAIALGSWLIGRAPECDMVVNQDAVSGHHCRLTETAHGFTLEDLRSSNGTFVNGKRITAKAPVKPKDQVMLGKTVPMPWPKRGEGRGHEPEARADKPVAKPELPGKVISIGRDPDNDVDLDYPTISGRHARITLTGAQACLEDLGSTNGTALGRPGARITQAPLKPDDVVFFGSLRVSAARLLQGTLSMGTEPHRVVTFDGKATVFGRDRACDVLLNYPMISTRHARLWREGAALMLADLDSTNGTFLNGQRIRQATPVKPGDVIGLGSFSFKLNDQGNLEKRDDRGNITLEARAVSVDVPGKRLIEQISLTVFPGELVGLMGPSGAGKSTLLNALNGYTAPTQGEVILNNHDLYEHYQQFAPYLGYVPQEDIIHRTLTVYQALYYTARLRLPQDYTEDDIRTRIQEVMKQLGLEGTENVLIGSPEKRGISGGQRKRVNLAMELITDPLLLFLDEPTSGLSSEDALMVMKLLRRLADAGKTSFPAFWCGSCRQRQHRDAGRLDPGRGACSDTGSRADVCAADIVTKTALRRLR